jgi:hypothetical protein
VEFKVLDFLGSALKLHNAFASDKPFMAGKLGNCELMCCYNLLRARHLNPNASIDWMPVIVDEIYHNAGVFPQTEQARITFVDEIVKALQVADFVAAWNNGLAEFERRLILSSNSKSTLIDLCALEPFYSGIPWSQFLKDKNVLVISPFTKTIEQQYKQREKLWKNPLVLPSFNLITLYHPTSKGISGDRNKYGTWLEMVDDLKQKMTSINYDVCIVGTGASSLPLCAHAKLSGKQSIHLGGPTQILFGIKGKRWDEAPNINVFYNDTWTRPSAEEIPEGFKKIEAGCYW